MKSVTESTPLLPFLFAQWPEAKRNTVKQWLRFGAVNVNERIVTQHDYVLQPGDIVQIRTQKAPSTTVPLPMGLSVAYEDSELLVVLKPTHLLTVATESERDKTAFRIMTEYLRAGSGPAQDRLWIVHRLDRETSGLLVFAKSEEVKIWLQKNWKRMEKRYQAIVEGHLPRTAGTLTGHLDESQPHRVFAAMSPTLTTREAITHYRVLGTDRKRSLLELTLETGRRHQIRVQLAAAGCPIVGDKRYEAKSNPIKRIALHATSLKLLHPHDERELVLQSPLPKEMSQLAPVVFG